MEDDIKTYKKIVLQNIILFIITAIIIIVFITPLVYRIYIKIDIKNKQKIINSDDVKKFNSLFILENKQDQN